MFVVSAPASLDVGMLLVFAIIVVALALFATEPVPIDVTALGIMVALMVFGPWTGISPEEGISGFASTATVTVLAMFILSAGVQATGIVQILGRKLTTYTRDSEFRQLASTIGIVGPISGFINNTAAVAILLPMVIDVAEDGGTSPSKLLIPLSYASMFGGTLTLIGTSTNILASSVAADLGVAEAPFGMFEFTALGAVVAVVGTAYLLTVGRWLTPARIEPTGDLTEEFEMGEYLTEVVVRESSPMVGYTVEEALGELAVDADVFQLVRDGRTFAEPLARKTVRPGDILVIRMSRTEVVDLLDVEGLDLVHEAVTGADLEAAEQGRNLIEVVIGPGSSLVGESLASANFRDRYDATVLAMRRGDELIRRRMDRLPLRIGDTLLVQAAADAVGRLDANRDFILAREIERHDYREGKIPVALAIIVGVVGLAALDVLPIVVAALAGSLAVVVTGCLRPGELYDAVQWDVIVLLAGVIPLGIAMQETGGARLLADLLVASAGTLPDLAVLGLFYVLTALLTNVISNNASVVLMIPVAVQTAAELGADPFAFVLAVTFAASTAFMTPVGYQTNLFVYGPGGYRFTDYVRVGAPLQVLFTVATTVGIWAIWGIHPA